MKTLEIRLSTVGLLLFVFCAACAQMPAKKIAVSGGNLCVTEGAVENGAGGRLSVDAPKMRAYVNTWSSQAIEAQFTYLGPTAEESKLGSGEIRRQFGLKLRAQNACNLCTPCGDLSRNRRLWFQSREILTKPEARSAETTLRLGDTHTLGAELNGEELRVFVDNRAVWEGSIGPDAQDLQGPVGIRSDNVRLALDLKAGAVADMHQDYKLACKSGPDASD